MTWSAWRAHEGRESVDISHQTDDPNPIAFVYTDVYTYASGLDEF